MYNKRDKQALSWTDYNLIVWKYEFILNVARGY